MNFIIFFTLSFISILPTGNPLLHYRLPETRTSLFTIYFQPFSFVHNYYGLRWSNSLDGYLLPKYDILITGERLYLSGSVSTSFQGDLLQNRYPTDDEGGFISIKGNSFAVQPNLSSVIDWYPIKLPLGLGVDCRSDFYYEVKHFNPDSNDYVPQGFNFPEKERNRRIHIDLLAGPSIGRIREAKTVILALRIGEILKENGFLEHELSDSDVQELAQLLSRDKEFALKWERPNKYFYQALESLMVRREIISERLPGLVWFRIKDEIESPNFSIFIPNPYERHKVGIGTGARAVGVKLSIQAGIYYINWDSHKDFTDSVLDYSNTQKIPELQVGLVSGYPFNTKLQFNQAAYWTIQSESIGTTHTLNANIELSYRLLDRLLASVFYSGGIKNKSSWGYSETGYHIDYNHFYQSPGVGFKYYIEDRLSLSASIGFYDEEYRRDSPTAPFNGYAHFSYDLSFVYRLK